MMPQTLKFYNITDENQINSIFSAIGKISCKIYLNNMLLYRVHFHNGGSIGQLGRSICIRAIE
jgi:hypothetical protein